MFTERLKDAGVKAFCDYKINVFLDTGKLGAVLGKEKRRKKRIPLRATYSSRLRNLEVSH